MKHLRLGSLLCVALASAGTGDYIIHSAWGNGRAIPPFMYAKADSVGGRQIADSMATERHRDTLSTRSIVRDASLAIRSAMGAYLPLAGGTLTGTVVLTGSGQSFAGGAGYDFLTSAPMSSTIIHKGNGASTAAISFPKVATKSFEVAGSAAFDSSVALTVKSAPFLGTDSAGRIIACSAPHDTADALRAYARARIHGSLAALTPARIGAEPLWSTANAIPKGNGSTGLTASSLSDDGTTVSTGERITSTFAGGAYYGPYGISSVGTYPGIEFYSTSAPSDSKMWDWTVNPADGALQLTAGKDIRSTGTQTFLNISRSGISLGNAGFYTTISAPGIRTGTDTITGLTTAGLVTNTAAGVIGTSTAAGLGLVTGGPYALTTALSDTADTLRPYARARIHDSLAALTPARIGAEPHWSTANAIPKGNGSTGLTASSLSDDGTTVSTGERITSTFAGGAYYGPYGISSVGTYPGIEFYSTSAPSDSKMWDWTVNPADGALQLTAGKAIRSTGTQPSLNTSQSAISLGNAGFYTTKSAPGIRPGTDTTPGLTTAGLVTNTAAGVIGTSTAAGLGLVTGGPYAQI